MKKAKTAYSLQLLEIDKRLKAILDFIETLNTNNNQINFNMNTQVLIPEIITANTYLWSSNGSADARRRAEERRQSEAAHFFKSIGLEVARAGDTVTAIGHGLEIEFHYSESCKNVYKSCIIYRNGKKSNISSLKKLIAA